MASFFLRSSRCFSTHANANSSLRNFVTASDVTTALRPFYFLVHPDLFGRFPKEQAVNEKSIKQLKQYVDTLVLADSAKPTPTDVKFYLRPSGAMGGTDSNMRHVTISLDSRNLRQTLQNVLRVASLPTSFVDSLPEDNKPEKKPPPFIREEDYFDDEKDKTSAARRHKMDASHPLDSWLEANVEEARKRLEEVEPTVMRATRIKDELCSQYGLGDVVWLTDWQKYTRINKLEWLRTLLEGQPGVRELLADKVIVFCDGGRSGVTRDGQLALFAGEVLENWLWHIRQMPGQELFLAVIPALEKRLSAAMGGARIVKRKSRVLMLADEYVASLQQVIKSAEELHWPKDMHTVEVSVESAESPMMVSPQGGQIIAPCNISGRNLKQFVLEHKEEAARVRRHSMWAEAREAEMIAKCVKELCLVDFRKADGLDPDCMVLCCLRLLKYAWRIRHLTHGNYVEVNSYYDVNTNGVITIPYFWLEEEQRRA